LRAELIGERARPLRGPVYQMNPLEPALDQSKYHGARCPPGSQHQRIGAAAPSGRAGVEIVDEALDIGVGRKQLATFVPQCVGGADRARARVGPGQRQRALLVRNGDVGADKTVAR
jgi:hypothetical protein